VDLKTSIVRDLHDRCPEQVPQSEAKTMRMDMQRS
jgi:hypothetical protein